MATQPQSPKTSGKIRSLGSFFAISILLPILLRWGSELSLFPSSTNTEKISNSSDALLPSARAGQSLRPSSINKHDLLRAQYAVSCPDHSFKTRVFSSDPVIMYLQDYLSPAEIEYLIDLADPYYQQSPVSKGYELKAYDYEIRSSMSAVLPNDPVVACIEQRSVDFQGFMSKGHLEDIQVVKYIVGDHFRPHFDWFSGMENPRHSTIFVYLACDSGKPESAGSHGSDKCQGGATQFPHYEGRFPSGWCEFIDCHDESGAGGVGFMPIPGNAVFWENYYSNGTGHPGVWHAGMPVLEGRKLGLNIFTRKNEL